METEETPLYVSPEEYFMIEERVEVKLEYDQGRIVPKEGSRPLPDWVVRELLKPDFDESTLEFEFEMNDTLYQYEFPMATQKHDDLILNLQRLLYLEANSDKAIKVYGQGPKVYISLTGKYRVPDVTISPVKAEQEFIKDRLVNPIAIFEVLSESTAEKDHNEKLDEYLNIESLQEYFLVAQTEQKIQRYRRMERKTDGRSAWEYYVFREGTLPISCVQMELDIAAVYQDT